MDAWRLQLDLTCPVRFMLGPCSVKPKMKQLVFGKDRPFGDRIKAGRIGC